MDEDSKFFLIFIAGFLALVLGLTAITCAAALFIMNFIDVLRNLGGKK